MGNTPFLLVGHMATRLRYLTYLPSKLADLRVSSSHARAPAAAKMQIYLSSSPSLASWLGCLPSGKLSLLPGSSVIMMRMRGGGGAPAAISDSEAPNPNSEMELIVEA